MSFGHCCSAMVGQALQSHCKDIMSGHFFLTIPCPLLLLNPLSKSGLSRNILERNFSSNTHPMPRHFSFLPLIMVLPCLCCKQIADVPMATMYGCFKFYDKCLCSYYTTSIYDRLALFPSLKYNPHKWRLCCVCAKIRRYQLHFLQGAPKSCHLYSMCCVHMGNTRCSCGSTPSLCDLNTCLNMP